MINIFSSKRLQECMLAAHIVLTEIKMKFFDRTDLTKNYEYTYIWLHVAFFSVLNFLWETRKRMEFLTRNEKKTRKILPHKMMIIALQIHEGLFFTGRIMSKSFFCTFFHFYLLYKSGIYLKQFGTLKNHQKMSNFG